MALKPLESILTKKETQIMSNKQQSVEIKLVNPKLQKIPRYETEHAAGLDLQILLDESIELRPGEQTGLISTGVAINILDKSMFAAIYPRSSSGVKGVTLANTVGIIDPDYQGEIKLCIRNVSNKPIFLKDLDRVAQLIFQPVIRPNLTQVGSFSTETKRGCGGFGITDDNSY